MNLTAALSTALLLAGALFSQKPEVDAAAKPRVDPFTAGEEKGMKALGIVAYEPLQWAEGKRTDDIEKVLGENHIMWLETAHFRIGSTLASTAAPDDPEVKKMLKGELQRLHKRWAKIPESASKLAPWLRLHLYAQRAEELYAEFALLVGHDETTGTHLGQRDKLLILLFDKKSDLVRYLDRFCGRQSENSQGIYHGGQNGIVVTAEGDEQRDEASVHAQFRFLLLKCFQDAIGGTPYWLNTGLAHWYERQVPAMLMNCGIKEGEHVDQQSQNKWREKMHARAQRDTLVIPFATLCTTTDFGYFAHLQAWSRVDCLLALDRTKFGKFLAATKGAGSGENQMRQLEEIFGMNAEAFDARWREWVTKNYK